MDLTFHEKSLLDKIQVALKLQEIACLTDNEGIPWTWLQSCIDDGTRAQQENRYTHISCQMQSHLGSIDLALGGAPESPIEVAFWEKWLEGPQHDFPLIPQYQLGRYRLDFAHVKTFTAIELDGHATHSSPDAIARDRKRQRDIERMGWHVLRFGGKEIRQDVDACVLETWELLVMRTNEVVA